MLNVPFPSKDSLIFEVKFVTAGSRTRLGHHHRETLLLRYFDSPKVADLVFRFPSPVSTPRYIFASKEYLIETCSYFETRKAFSLILSTLTDWSLFFVVFESGSQKVPIPSDSQVSQLLLLTTNPLPTTLLSFDLSTKTSLKLSNLSHLPRKLHLEQKNRKKINLVHQNGEEEMRRALWSQQKGYRSSISLKPSTFAILLLDQIRANSRLTPVSRPIERC